MDPAQMIFVIFIILIIFLPFAKPFFNLAGNKADAGFLLMG
jgi:hypothetical protein